MIVVLIKNQALSLAFNSPNGEVIAKKIITHCTLSKKGILKVHEAKIFLGNKDDEYFILTKNPEDIHPNGKIDRIISTEIAELFETLDEFNTSEVFKEIDFIMAKTFIDPK